MTSKYIEPLPPVIIAEARSQPKVLKFRAETITSVADSTRMIHATTRTSQAGVSDEGVVGSFFYYKTLYITLSSKASTIAQAIVAKDEAQAICRR